MAIYIRKFGGSDLALFTQFTFQIIVQQTQALENIKATTDGGSTFYHIGKQLEIAFKKIL